MKQTLVAIVLAATAAFATITAATSPAAVAGTQHTQHHGSFYRCHYKGRDGRWTTYEVQETIRCAVAHFPTSLSTAMYVANRESNFSPRAVNRYSGTSGIYQHMMAYWPTRVASFRQRHPFWHIYPSVFNARSNVLVSIDMAHRSGWGPWGG